MEVETLGVDGAVQLTKRHSALHKVNINYGYALFAATVLLVGIRTVSLWYYERGWKRSGRSTTMISLSNIPTSLTVASLALVTAILLAIKPHLEQISVLIKRTGRFAYVLVPLDIFLAARPAWFGVDNYLNTIQLHKWVSRLILILLLTHSVGFLCYYASQGTLGNVLSLSNFFGVLVFVISTLMLVFFKPIRNLSYQFFYVYHNVFMILFVFLIYLHARPGVSFYFLLNFVLLSAGIFKKYMFSKDIAVSEIVEQPGSDYKIIKFPKTLLPENYLPASHIRLGYSKWSLLFSLLPSHPYTVATIYEDRNLLSSLVVKQTRFKIEPFETYSIQTNLKSSLSSNFFQTAENVSIICGGSGISFGLGIFEYFKRAILLESRDIKVKFLWITRHEEDMFILKDLGIEGVEIYITNSNTDDLAPSNDELEQGPDVVLDENLTSEAMELTDVDALSVDDDELNRKFTNLAIIGKRPDIESIIAKNLAKTIDYGNKWIVSCGPATLNKECEKIAIKHKCRFFQEEYSF